MPLRGVQSGREGRGKDYPSITSTVRARGEGKRRWIVPLRGVQSGQEGREKGRGLSLLEEYSQGERGGKKNVDYAS